MAPKKRSDKQQGPAKPELQARVTRSSAKRAAKAGPAESEPELLKKKKTNKAAKKEEEHEEKNSAPNSKTVVIEQPEPELPKRKAKKVEKKEEELEEVNSDTTAKTIVIEHCKQCNSFKTRAIQVKEGLEKSVAGITVLVNPEKPRRGCFEIREDGGEKFISLVDMKRPFAPMKALDMEKVIYDIVDGIK
ncbi:uncharacterized protein LOC132189938 [Corylus avellana]|uniref:uncharacterized protein LOC132189938 n=1 Tax=Corylus avellana TaxID=13451 RepID=UPI001E1EF761|nr:uncharacterized protein LOC132189938 [Corylus avellana]